MSDLLKAQIKAPQATHYDGEDKDERILYLLRGSLITNFRWISIAILMALTPFLASLLYQTKIFGEVQVSPEIILSVLMFWYLSAFGFALHNFLLWYFNTYIITNKKIVDLDFKGLLYKNISEAPIRNIEDVTSNISSLMGTIFNFGDVYIQTSAEKREFEFENVNNPSKIRDLISDLVEEVKYE